MSPAPPLLDRLGLHVQMLRRGRVVLEHRRANPAFHRWLVRPLPTFGRCGVAAFSSTIMVTTVYRESVDCALTWASLGLIASGLFSKSAGQSDRLGGPPATLGSDREHDLQQLADNGTRRSSSLARVDPAMQAIGVPFTSQEFDRKMGDRKMDERYLRRRSVPSTSWPRHPMSPIAAPHMRVDPTVSTSVS